VHGPRIKALMMASLSAVAIAALSGCDSNENADLANGRQLFNANCARCHSLKEAGATAVVGPNLDAAFAGARHSGQDQDTIEGVVEAQIENPRPADSSDPTYMPPGILEGQEKTDVAAYIASVAGVPGIEPPKVQGGAGGQIFADNSCATCHTLAAAGSAGNTGPNLDEVLPGQSTQDITKDIVDPSAEVEQGFADGLMPDNYEQSIDPADLKVLVKFLADNAGKVNANQGG
jgi:cytochrome c2